MLTKIKKFFEKKEPVPERLPFYDIVCPYCFAKFHHEEVVFRATHDKEDDERYCLQPDDKLNEYRKRFGLDDIELEAVIDASTIADENKMYSGKLLIGISDRYGEMTKIRLCPKCHNDLPVNAGKHPSNIISIVGGTSVGKSVFITSLIHTLQHSTANNFAAACTPLNQDISRRFKNNYEIPLFETGSLLGSTQKRQKQEPFIYEFVFKDINKEPLTLVFFDIAGEGMTEKEYLKLYGLHIKNSAGILFLVDPVQIRAIRSRLIYFMGENPGEIATQGMDPEDVVTTLFEDFIFEMENSRTNIPTAIVLTKSDLLHALKDDSEYFSTNSNVFRNIAHKEYLNLDEILNINGEIRRFLEKVDVPFVNVMDVRFNNASYFAVSALGRNPVAGEVDGVISPTRVDEPFIWLLHKLGYIEGRHVQ